MSEKITYNFLREMDKWAARLNGGAELTNAYVQARMSEIAPNLHSEDKQVRHDAVQVTFSLVYPYIKGHVLQYCRTHNFLDESEIQDIFQATVSEVLAALPKYDINQGALSTFVSRYLNCGTRVGAQEYSMPTISPYYQAKINRLKAIVSDYKRKYNVDEVSPKEIALLADLPIGMVRQLLQMDATVILSVEELAAKVNVRNDEDKDVEASSLLQNNDSSYDPVESTEKRDQISTFNKLLHQYLTDDEYKVLCMSHGAFEYSTQPPMDASQVARALGITEIKVGFMMKTARAKMRDIPHVATILSVPNKKCGRKVRYFDRDLENDNLDEDAKAVGTV